LSTDRDDGPKFFRSQVGGGTPEWQFPRKRISSTNSNRAIR